MKLDRKHYMEDVDVLNYIEKNVPKQQDSKWIREATRSKMEKEIKKQGNAKK